MFSLHGVKKLTLFNIQGGDDQRVAVDAEVDVVAVEEHGIATLGVVVVVRTGVLRQGQGQGTALPGGKRRQQAVGVKHTENRLGLRRRETATGLGVAVGIGEVGFDVEYGGSVDEVGTDDVEDGAEARVVVDGDESDRGKAYGVWAEGAARSEDADALVAAEARGADGGAPLLPLLPQP